MRSSITLFRFICLSAAALLMTGGCGRPYGVPPFSQLGVQAPAGQIASFEAPDEGTIYVNGPGRQGGENHLVYSGLVHQGEVVTLDPPNNQLLIDGKPVAASLNNAGGGYSLWFHAVRHDLLAP